MQCDGSPVSASEQISMRDTNNHSCHRVLGPQSTCLQTMQAHSIYESSLSRLHFLIHVEGEQSPVTATGRRLLRTLRQNSWKVALLGERAEWDRIAPAPAAYTNGADTSFASYRGWRDSQLCEAHCRFQWPASRPAGQWSSACATRNRYGKDNSRRQSAGFHVAPYRPGK